MKKFIDVLIYILMSITSIIIICTFLTTYQFYYVNQIFNSYVLLELSLSATMLAMAIRFLLDKDVERRILYCVISITIAMSFIYFAMNWIK